jgi:hypothetical protein
MTNVLRELSKIESVTLESGYQCVYRHRGKWRGVPCPGVGSTQVYATPTQAAKAVISWWVSHFGEEWYEVFARREERFRIEYVEFRRPRKCFDGAGSSMWSWHGVLLKVWVMGELVVVRPGGKAKYFATESAAKKYLREWADNELGMFAKAANVPYFPAWLYSSASPDEADSACSTSK